MEEPSLESEFEPENWRTKNFTERVRAGTRAYVTGGLRLPWRAYVIYPIKITVFFVLWAFFCSFTPGLGDLSKIGTWMWEGAAFQKLFIWGSMYEVLGFGVMTGPLGFRMWPPFTAGLHFATPGTIKLAPFPDMPIVGGATRSWLDVGLYLTLLAAYLHALTAPVLSGVHFLPILILVPLCGLTDKTIVLAARAEHYVGMVLCFFLAGNWIAGAKAVQLAIWFWAGVSKLTPAFAYVVPIMTANNPLVRSAKFRRALFADYPNDLRPSRISKAMAHAGTFLEFAAPITLFMVTDQGPLMWLGMFFVLMLHGFILSNLPVAAVFEWNLISIYAAFFLFVHNPEVRIAEMGSQPLALLLMVGLVLLPMLGNLVPSTVSFLISMRYYAGNWAWNAWLFRDGSERKLDKLKRYSPLYIEALKQRMTPQQANMRDGAFLAFRAMHLQGRVLGMVLPKALDGPFEDYTYSDGELVAATTLGWNFGEGHLHDERLMRVIQRECGFKDGELRAVMVEAQSLLGTTLHWRIVDAESGLLDEGYADIADLARRAPWDYGEE